MAHGFAEIAFTPTVQAVQVQQGSRAAYARMEGGAERTNHRLGRAEAAFIAARDSFYLASVGETGWPYIQHRGGPVGFVRVLDDTTIGFADFRGNRQYVTVGNLMTDTRVALFFMDYAGRTRLKLFGHAALVGLEDDATLSRLEMPDYRARIERGLLITVAGFDWNCPQHIPVRLTLDESPVRVFRQIAAIGQKRVARRSEFGRLRLEKGRYPSLHAPQPLRARRRSSSAARRAASSSPTSRRKRRPPVTSRRSPRAPSVISSMAFRMPSPSRLSRISCA
jgi:predicted pyridoxine 5'-phosphate oxidase superfamily flavin-nucleotide-binding protein